MKIISVNGNTVCVERKRDWLMYDATDGSFQTFLKSENPQYARALEAKWGFVPLKKPMLISNLKDIDIDKVHENQLYVKDYFA